MALTALAHTLVGALAITGARIEVGDGTVIEDGVVVVAGGKLVAVGPAARVVIPHGAERVDGAGKTVTPGLVAENTRVGLYEVGLEKGTVDTHMSGQATPAYRAVDGHNPLSPRIAIDREQGVTSAVLTPEGSLIYGQGYVVDMSGALSSSRRAQRVAMFGGFAGGARDAAGGSRGGVLLRLREIFDDVRFYQANKAAYDRAGARELSLSRVHLEALIDVVNGKLPLVFDVHRASDILALLALAHEQKIRVVVDGGSEAWLVAKELAAAKVPVILEPMAMEPWGFEALQVRDDEPALLAKAGVIVAIADSRELGTTRLRQQAGVAVSNGLDHEAALAAVTSVPARIFGVDGGADGVGVVAVGKRADLVVWSGDPFETATVAELVLIGGEKMSLETRQRELVKKYRALAR